MSEPHDQPDVRHLMMAAVDGELTAEERSALDQRLAADPELAAEMRQLERLKEVTSMTRIETPPEEHWGIYWQDVYNRMERGLGWILASIGAIVLACYGLWQAGSEILADADLPSFVKLAIFALGAGAVVLFVSALREKLFTRKHDPYKEVER